MFGGGATLQNVWKMLWGATIHNVLKMLGVYHRKCVERVRGYLTKCVENVRGQGYLTICVERVRGLPYKMYGKCYGGLPYIMC